MTEQGRTPSDRIENASRGDLAQIVQNEIFAVGAERFIRPISEDEWRARMPRLASCIDKDKESSLKQIFWFNPVPSHKMVYIYVTLKNEKEYVMQFHPWLLDFTENSESGRHSLTRAAKQVDLTEDKKTTILKELVTYSLAQEEYDQVVRGKE